MEEKKINKKSLPGWFWFISGVLLTTWTYDFFDKKKDPFNEILDIVSSSYVEELPKNKLLDNALRGLITNLDPHSVYWTPEELVKERDNIKGEYVGVGVSVNPIKNKGMRIKEILLNGPAGKAGLKVNDIILAVDEKKLEGDADKDVLKIRGPEGSLANFKINRNNEIQYVKVKRAAIDTPTVFSYVLNQNSEHGKIGFIKVAMFGEKTGFDFYSELEDCLNKGIEGLVIDLRGNSGGLINSAVDIASLFIEGGKKITYVKSRNGIEEEWNSDNEKSALSDISKQLKQKYPKLLDYNKLPILILVNSGSASASELLSLALRDYNRAKIVGERTFGKGSVQKVIPVKATGGALKLTFAKYYSPSGKSIQAIGLDPDFYAVNTELEDAIRNSTKRIYEKSIKGHLVNEKSFEDELDDKKELDGTQYNKQFSYAPLNNKNNLDPVSKTAVSILSKGFEIKK